MPPASKNFRTVSARIQAIGETEPEANAETKISWFGIFVSADGYIVTNNHVVSGADTIKVTMDRNGKINRFQGRSYWCRWRNGSCAAQGGFFRTIAFSGLLAIPDTLKGLANGFFAIGNPFWPDHSVTAGIPFPQRTQYSFWSVWQFSNFRRMHPSIPEFRRAHFWTWQARS